MRIDDLTEQHLGNSATQEDLEDFKTACRNYQKRSPELTEDGVIDHIWNDGDFMARMMYWKARK